MVWGRDYEFSTGKVTAMAMAQRYTMEQIEAARKKLRSLAVKTVGKTRAEVVELLGNDIRQAVRKGYTLHDIRKLLADVGISVSLARMRPLISGSDEKDNNKDNNAEIVKKIASVLRCLRLILSQKRIAEFDEV